MNRSFLILCIVFSFVFFNENYTYSQDVSYEVLTVSPEVKYQTIAGFGGSLAFYENWVTSHPKKAEIYEALFAELSLDILRLRNAYDYDAGMIARAKEFVEAAESSLGKPIDVLVTSWGPPGYLKSNSDRKNGGTLRYEVSGDKVTFDYPGFAHWWNNSLDEYNLNGIYPTYISIQNEPDFKATWESCLLRPSELIGVTDTIAGYNKALDMVYDSIKGRILSPKILGPETVGIGYNSVENYINAMDIEKLYGIGHHLYHGVDEINPYASSDFSKVGKLHPEIPHFQTEFSGGNWWSLAGLIYKSLHDENAVAYLYWDLAWTGTGLIDMDNPWSQSSWADPQMGYKKTKEFYGFKQFSAFIHPGWERVETAISGDSAKVLAFKSPISDSATVVVINTSKTKTLQLAISVPGYSIAEAQVYITSEKRNCLLISDTSSSVLEITPQSIVSIPMQITTAIGSIVDSIALFPANPSIDSRLGSVNLQFEIYPSDASNKTIFWQIISGSDLASLSQSGKLTALGTGNGIVKVRARAIDGSEAFSEIEVQISNQVLVESIGIKASAGEINTPMGTIQFSADVLPEEAFNKILFWELISGNEIATISQDGLLQSLGVADGDVKIRVSATDGSGVNKELTIKILNQIPISSIILSSDSTKIAAKLGSIQIVAVILPENATNKTLAWSLEQEDSIATIDPAGLLTATGKANGIVSVIAASTDNSDVVSQIEIEIVNQQTSAENRSLNDLRVWLSANTLFFEIRGNSAELGIRLSSTDGRVIYIGTIPANISSGSIALSGLDPGIYILEISGRERLSFKLMLLN